VLPGASTASVTTGLLASANRATNIARARELLAVPNHPKQPEPPEAPAADQPRMLPRPCTCCGARMLSSRPSRAAASPASSHADVQQ